MGLHAVITALSSRNSSGFAAAAIPCCATLGRGVFVQRLIVQHLIFSTKRDFCIIVTRTFRNGKQNCSSCK